MSMVTVPIRIPEEDYRKYRLEALKVRKSFAEFVRISLKYKLPKEDKEREKRNRKAAARILGIKKPIVPHKNIREIIEEGRKY